MTPDPGPPAPRLERPPHRDTVPPEEPTEPPPPGRDTLPPGTAAAGHKRGHTTHRPWSARRLPAALVASVIAAAAGAALIDVVAVRAGRQAAAWRKQLADELATRPVGDVWMLTGAAVAAAVGVWLIALALTPGLRRRLPLRSPGDCPPPQLRASLDRDGAAVLLRDAAMQVSGVSRARIRVRRHRIKARVDVRFRDPEQVKDDLATVLSEERGRLALSRPPRIVVRVRQRTV
ncbi:MAG: hypothetical protein JF597_32545 [Streptomyces sp.]|uniref:DUF6286 domain-containing protein n=1 Tax=Streptomyces sp. TaxID=1931 RepID=UPI0025FC6900|nr:DUF6286 domain-containing protein [Streptomyces sp.]MBW8798149.1 hypothetical protein [Streptomyces sp.]